MYASLEAGRRAQIRPTIGNIRGTGAKVSGFDPLTGTSVAGKLISRTSDRLFVEMPVTDSPRLLTVRDT